MTIDMNFVIVINITIILLTLYWCYSGFNKGFLLKLLSCLSFVVVVFLSWNIAEFFKFLHLLPKQWAPFASSELAPFFYDYANHIFIFILLVVVLSIALMVLRPIAKIIGDLPLISIFNRILGLFFGLAQSFIVIFLVTFLLTTPLFTNGTQVINKSILRYIEPLQEETIKILGTSMNDYAMFQQLNKSESDVDNALKIREWLQEKGFSDEEIVEFMVRLAQ